VSNDLVNLLKHKRLIILAQKLSALIDKLVGVQGELADLSEQYIAPTCPHCGGKLENDVHCPVCEKREQ
jgi:rubrerythrin